MSLYLWHKDDAEGQTADRAVRAPYLAVGAAMCWAQRPLQQQCSSITQLSSAQLSLLSSVYFTQLLYSITQLSSVQRSMSGSKTCGSVVPSPQKQTNNPTAIQTSTLT